MYLHKYLYTHSKLYITQEIHDEIKKEGNLNLDKLIDKVLQATTQKNGHKSNEEEEAEE